MKMSGLTERFTEGRRASELTISSLSEHGPTDRSVAHSKKKRPALQIFGITITVLLVQAALLISFFLTIANTKFGNIDKDGAVRTVANTNSGNVGKDGIVNLQLGLERTANVFEACSKEDLVIMEKHLYYPAFKTCCPQSNWIEDLYQEGFDLGSEDGSFLGVTIGCNKGFDAINTARMGMRNPVFDKPEWNKNLVARGVNTKGACGQHTSPQYELGRGEGLIKGEMHCVEPMPSTFDAVKNVADKLNLHIEGFVTTQAAISSRDGEISFPTGNSSQGAEEYSIASCNDQSRIQARNDYCTDIPMYSLQTYVDTYVKSKGPINILSVDVEGFDFDVLFGAGSVLDRTQYLEFEYHIYGSWAKLHVHDLVNLLDGKGFNCYWAGKKKLWRITNCELRKFDTWHGWSNVACVHRSQTELAQKMENLFLATIGKTSS